MGDLVDLAVAAAAERRAELQMQLSTGRLVRLDVPVPMSAEEVLEIVASVPGGIYQLQRQIMTAAGHIALPNGQVRPVPRDA